MRLSEYIATVGTAKAAEEFGVSKSAAASWRYLQRTPRPAKARQIELTTGGRVTFAECFPASVGARPE